MLRGNTIAIASVIGVTLLACEGPRVSGWEPYSRRMNDKQIAKTAMLIGEGDVGTVRSAGGLPAGTMTMRSDEYSAGTITEAAATEAAEFGGTHYMLGTFSESTSTDYSAGKIGETWVVVPQETTTRTLRFVVIRVPKSGWGNLPNVLTPAAYDEK
jgi:hypothetical protein